MQFFVGTSGYSYKEWKGGFYPENLPEKQMLSYYAQQFCAVELNSTFRRMPSESNFESWASQVPGSFRFALKAPQVITHFKRLKDAEEPTEHFFRTAAALKTKRGPVLLGLRDNFKKDLPRLRDFLRMLPKNAKAVFEFRHESWFDDDVFACLRARRCALCIHDDKEFPQVPFVSTTNWGYVRLRRERYTKKSLADWVSKLKCQPWRQAYVFFKHERTGTGPKLAARFVQLATDEH
jgi:uncharacterized protein YecE (DUF72 family)